jgi:pSer/pThr/pTyr-binding forkhead associated (FHA) protein
LRPAMLEILESDGSVRTHQLENEETLIGRGPTCDVRLIDKGTSREHATIMWEDDVHMLEDLQSTNGTKINGKRIRSGRLEDGDELLVGRTTLTFRLGS